MATAVHRNGSLSTASLRVFVLVGLGEVQRPRPCSLLSSLSCTW
ncbi:Olfactory receptor 12 [Apodemus speciosus]|uniref:Olfactory receptor 12 n=1 Tax=Apodemus speciosus TaxID=105296 RepID=A0ABQ0EDR5_APOSI